MKIDTVKKVDGDEIFLTIKFIDDDGRQIHSFPFYYKKQDIREDIDKSLKQAINDLPGFLNVVYKLGLDRKRIEFIFPPN
jgi:hypothetical protein